MFGLRVGRVADAVEAGVHINVPSVFGVYCALEHPTSASKMKNLLNRNLLLVKYSDRNQISRSGMKIEFCNPAPVTNPKTVSLKIIQQLKFHLQELGFLLRLTIYYGW